MKKLVKSLLALSILGLTGGTAVAGGMLYAKESGKQESSYAETDQTTIKIGSADDLSKLATNHSNAIYELTSDINLDNKLWTPIGTENAPFQGTIWGNGYEISGSIIVPESVLSNYYGIFGYTSGAKIYDLSIGESFTYTGANANAVSGSLIGYAKGTTVAAVYDKSSMTNTIGQVSGTDTTIYRGGNNFGGNATTVDSTVRVGAGTETKGHAVAFNVDDAKDTAKSAYYVDANGKKLMRNDTDKTETYYVAISAANAEQTLTNAPKNFGTTYPNTSGSTVSAKRKGYELVSESEWNGIKTSGVYSPASGFALADEDYTLRANWNQVTYTFNRFDRIGQTGTDTANSSNLSATMYSSWLDLIGKIQKDPYDLTEVDIRGAGQTSPVAKAVRTVTYDASGNRTLSDWKFYLNEEEKTGNDKLELVLADTSTTYDLIAIWQPQTVNSKISYSGNGGKSGLLSEGLVDNTGASVPIRDGNVFKITGNTKFVYKVQVRDGFEIVGDVTISGTGYSTAKALTLTKDGETYVYTCETGILNADNQININVKKVAQTVTVEPSQTDATFTTSGKGSFVDNTISAYCDEDFTMTFTAKTGYGISVASVAGITGTAVCTYTYTDANGATQTTTSSANVPDHGAEKVEVKVTNPTKFEDAKIEVTTVKRTFKVTITKTGATYDPAQAYPDVKITSSDESLSTDGVLFLGTGAGSITANTDKYYIIESITFTGTNGTANPTFDALTGAFSGVKVNGTYTITVKYAKKPYKITYNPNGGSADATSQTVYNLDKYLLPNATKEGHTFEGWYTSGDVKVENSSTIDLTADQTYTAKWTVESHTINFDSNGGSIVSSITQNYGTAITLPTPTRTGYKFEGWYDAEENDNGTGDKITWTTMPDLGNNNASKTLYAKWAIESYTLKFESNGGTPCDNITGNYGASVTLPTPTKAGYTFNGWYDGNTDGNGSGNKIEYTTMPELGDNGAVKTLYANWSANTYTINFDSNGGSSVNSISGGYGTAITLPTPTKAGYTFNGWYDGNTDGNGSGNKIEYTTMPDLGNNNTSVTLYAHWDANTYKLVFNNNDGTGKTTNKDISYDEIILNECPSAPTAQGLTFKGWAIEKTTGNFVIVSDEDIFNNSFISGIAANAGGTYTLYAMWEISESDIIYTLNLNSKNVEKTSGNGQIKIDSSPFASGTVYGNSTSATNLFNVEVYKDSVLTTKEGSISVGSWAKSVILTITLNGRENPKIVCTIVPFEGMKNAFATKEIKNPAYFGVTASEYNFEIIQSKDQLDLAAQYVYEKIGTEALADTRDGRISQGRDTLLKLMKANSTLKANIYNVLGRSDLDGSLSNDELNLALCSTFGLFGYDSNIWTTNIDEVTISDVGTIDKEVFKSWEDLDAGVYDSWWKLSGDLTNVNLGTLYTDYKVIEGVYYVRNSKTVRETEYNLVKEQEVISTSLPDNAVMLYTGATDYYTYTYTDDFENKITIKTNSGAAGEYTQIGDTNFFTIESIIDKNGNDITNSALFWIPGTLTIQDADLLKLNYSLMGIYAKEGDLNDQQVGFDKFNPKVAVTKIRYNDIDYAYESGFAIDANGLVSVIGKNILLGYIYGQGTANLTVQLLNGITFEYTVTQPESGEFAEGNPVGLIETTTEYAASLNNIKSLLAVNGAGALTREVTVEKSGSYKLILTRALAVKVDLSARDREDYTDWQFVNMNETLDLSYIYPMQRTLSDIAKNPKTTEFTLMGQYKDANGKKWYIFELPGKGTLFEVNGEDEKPTTRVFLDETAFASLTANANGTYYLPADTTLNIVAYPGFTYTTVTGSESEVTIEGTVVGIADQHTSFTAVHVKVNWTPYSIPLITGTQTGSFTASETGTSFDAKNFITSIEGFDFSENGMDTISYKWKGTNSNILTLKSVDDAKTYTIVITLTSKVGDYESVEYVYDVTFTAVKQTIGSVDISSTNGLSNATNSYEYANKDLYSGLTVAFKDASGNAMTLGSGMYAVTKEAASKNVGSYSVKVALTEEGKKYYDFADYTFNFEITKKEISISDADISNKTKVYDGTTLVASSVYTALGEKVDITFKAVGPDAKSYKAEVESIKVGGVDSGNYTVKLTDDNNTWLLIDTYSYILKESDIKDGSKTKVYTGQVLTPDEITLTLIEGETLTISFNKAGKDVGKYSPAIKSITINNNATSNYEITLPENKWFSITPFKYTLNAEDVSFTKVYGTEDKVLSKEFAAGTFAHEGNVELKNPDALTLTFTRAEGNTVGTYALLTVTVDDANKGNYEITLPENKWFSITKAKLTFTVEKVYDGTTAFTNENVTNVTGKVGNDEILISGNYPSKDATTSVGITDYKLSGAANANYSVLAVTGTITKFAYTLTQEDVKLSKVYGHADPALKVTLAKNTEGISNPDELVITFTREEGSSVGKYKLTIATVKYSSGDDATNNYTITIPDNNTFFEIEAVKQGLMVVVDGEFAMTYDTTTVTRVATEYDSNSSKWSLAAYTADGALKARVGLSLYINAKVSSVEGEDTWEVKPVTSDLDKMFTGITISISENLGNAGKYALSISGHNDIYTADATFVDSSYVSASPVFEIKKFTKVLTASELTEDSSWTKTYDGTALTPNSVTKEFIAGETVTINFASVGTDAKKYALSVSDTENKNYEISVKENELLEITKRAYTLTASDVASVNSKVYTKSTITPDSIELTLVNNEKLTISFSAVSGTTVGEYEMVVSSVMIGENDATNYEIKAEAGNKWFSITKFKYTVVEGDLGQDYKRTKTYDGTSLKPAAITKELNGETIEISFKETGVNVGDYALEFASVDNDNYDITISANTWLRITEYTYELKESDLTTSESKTAVYTSKAITPGSITLEKVTGETLTIAFEDVEKTVGKKALVIKSVMIGGEVATNYIITIPAGNTWFTITKAELTVEITKVYDGTTAFTNENVTNVTGLMGGDSVTVEGNFDSADVTSEAVSITDITLSGVDKDNYSVKATGKIVKANLTGVTVSDATKTYGDIKESDDYAKLLSGTLTFSSDLVKNAVITEAEIVKPTYSTGRFLSVGEYDVKLSVSSDTVDNFEVTLKLVIEAKALTVKLMKNGSEQKSVSKYYDGSDVLPEGVTVAVDGLCAGDQVELKAKFRSAEVGESVPVDYTFTADTDKNNYDITYTVQTGTIGSVVFSKITLNNSHYTFAKDEKTNPADRDINNFKFTNTVTGESFMSMLGTPSREGYTFLGWYREADHTSQMTSANAINYIKEYANKSDSFTLYSNWKAIEIVVTLDANNGTIAANPEVWTGSGATATKAIIYGTTYGTLPVPTRTGYTFSVWKYAGTTINETSSMFVSTSHTLKAEWQTNTYTVKFNKNGADCEDLMEDMTFTYDETVIPANLFTFTGHKFLGWKVNNEGEIRTEGEGNLSSDQDAVVELFAQWQIEKYNLTFNLNGGTTESTIDGTYEYDQKLPTNLTKVIAEKTYRFLGWSLTNEANPTEAQTYTNCPDIGEDGASATLYAMWTISDFDLTITLSNNGYATYTIMTEDGTVVAPIAAGGSEYRLNAGLVYKLTINLKPGYIFGAEVADFDPSKVTVDIENNVLTISKINSNTEITVNVEARLNTITINATHATVTKVTVYNGEKIDREITEESITSMKIYTGQKVVIHADPDAGYEIEDRTIEGFTADETINISATAKTYALTVANSEGNEEPTFISGWTAGMIKTDTPIVLEVKVKDHYTNLQLSAPEGISIVEESEGRYTITGFTDTFTLTITTEKMKYDVVMNSVSVKRDEVDNASTNRTTITTSETKALTGNGSETISTAYLTSFTFTASAQQAGYVFDGWYIGLVMENGRITDYGVKVNPDDYTYDPSTNVYSYTGTVEDEYSLTAVFKYIEYTMSIAVDSTYNYGTFNYGTDEGLTNAVKLLPFGNTVEVKPVGNKGYEFDKWIVNGEVLTESNADLGIELFADGTLNVTGKGNLDLVVLFKAKGSTFKAETDIYINGIKVSSEGTNCATMQVGTLDEYGNFKANANSTKFTKGNVPFYTGDDIYLQVELSYGYEFAGFVSEGEGEAVVVDNDYRPGKTTIGEGINQKTYYVRKITSLNADNIYQTLKLRVNATAVNLTVNFINEDNKVVDAGKIFVDDADFGVLANGNSGPIVSINAMVNKELTITAYSRFDFSIVSTGSCYKINNPSDSISIEGSRQDEEKTTGFTASYKFSVRNFTEGTEISIRVVSASYNVELYDEGNLIGERIAGVRVGDMLNTTNVTAAIRELAASKSQYELIGFYTSENGIGDKYIDNDGNCLKAWNENGYYWNGQEYATLPNFDPTTNTVKLYASWARMKSAIKISTIPQGIKDVNPTVAAKLVITTINNTNSWTTENDLFFADMLYGADIGITAPVYENYLFNSWTIILDGVVQDPIYESTYFKRGGFNCKNVEIYANYFAKVSLSAEKGGTATLTSGNIVINAGSEGYIPTTTEFTLSATPNKGYIFKGWFNTETGDLISNAINYVYRLDSENELSPISIVAKFEGEAVSISIGDYDKSKGHIEKIYLNGEKVDEPINARIGDEVEFYVYVDTSKKYGIKWNSQFITYDRKDAVSMANTECLIYKYIVNADDVVDGEIVIAPTITEDKINVRLDIRLFNDSEYGEAGEITGDGIVDGKLSLSFGEDLVITIKVNEYYKIETIQLDSRTIGEYLAGEMLIIPSSALNGLDATKEHVLLIKFTEKLWIETNNLPAQLQGDGTERNPYLITSAEELALVVYKINIEKNQSYANSRFKLTKDISLIGKFWTPIGTEDCKFNGVFNFNGFKVYGLSLQSGYDKENTYYNGVFGYLGDRAEIIINNNAITIIAISCSVGVAVIIIGLTIFFVVRKKRKKKMEELANG